MMSERTSPDAFKKYVHGTLLVESSGKAWSNVSVQILSHHATESNLLVSAGFCCCQAASRVDYFWFCLYRRTRARQVSQDALNA